MLKLDPLNWREWPLDRMNVHQLFSLLSESRSRCLCFWFHYDQPCSIVVKYSPEDLKKELAGRTHIKGKKDRRKKSTTSIF